MVFLKRHGIHAGTGPDGHLVAIICSLQFLLRFAQTRISLARCLKARQILCQRPVDKFSQRLCASSFFMQTVAGDDWVSECDSLASQLQLYIVTKESAHNLSHGFQKQGGCYIAT